MTVSTFIRASAQALSSRTLVYTAGTGVTAIVFDGQVTNIDSTNKISHFITIEVRLADAVTYQTIFKELEVPYGLTTPIPKIVLAATERIYITSADATNNTLEMGAQIIERVG